MRLAPIVFLAVALTPSAALPEMRGHGGPVKALAISGDGATIVSGGLDTAVIRWSHDEERAEQVMRFHAGGVTAVATLPQEWALSGGEDGRIAIWSPQAPQPVRVLDGHQARSRRSPSRSQSAGSPRPPGTAPCASGSGAASWRTSRS